MPSHLFTASIVILEPNAAPRTVSVNLPSQGLARAWCLGRAVAGLYTVSWGVFLDGVEMEGGRVPTPQRSPDPNRTDNLPAAGGGVAGHDTALWTRRDPPAVLNPAGRSAN